MIHISTETKKRGRPKSKPTPSLPTQTVTNTNTTLKQITYNLSSLFTKLNGSNEIVPIKIKNYTLEDLEMYIADPIRYIPQLIDINNYMYNYSPFFQHLIDYSAKMPLYRWTVDTEITNEKFYNPTTDKKLRKDYIEVVNRVNQLNLGVELNRLLTIMFLEDCVYGYWLENENASTIYYLPSSWCSIKNKVNGMYTYSINAHKPSQKDFERLPKELQSLIIPYKDKFGDDAYVPIPYEKAVCFKWNNHFDYAFPPMTGVIQSLIEIVKMKQINLTKSELDTMNLIEMLIPVAEDEDNHLRLYGDIIDQFAGAASDVINKNSAIIPTPMKLNVLPLNKSQGVDKNIVKDSIDSFNEESQMPSFGSANNASEMKKSIENSSAGVFAILRQISNSVNLKLKLEGYFGNSYSFKFKLLNMTVFNETEVQDALTKGANAGAINKFEWQASYGKSPAVVLGQSRLENVIFSDIFEHLTVLPSAHVQSGNNPEDKSSGRPTNESKGKPKTKAGDQTEDGDYNDPDNRDV